MKSREFLFCLASSLAVMPSPLKAEAPSRKPLPPQAKADGAVILKMMQRDRIVTVKAGGAAPLYTVETKTGDILVRDASVDELKQNRPEVYEIVKDAIAGASGLLDASNSRDSKIDASVR